MRRVPSGIDVTIDEAATVQKIADEGIWMPVTQSVLEPWLELALVIDESHSMFIWRQTILELQRLLQHYGAFRDVRIWGLVTDNKGKLKVRPGIGVATKNQVLRNVQELIDPSGRRLILVITDCVSPMWHGKEVLSTLKVWAENGPMAIAQMLPEWLWVRTALRYASAVYLYGLEPGVANQDLWLFEVVTVNAQGKIIKREQRQSQYYDEDLGNGIILEMVRIPGGKFMMGSPEGEGDDDEHPQHEVTVQPFYMGKYPVTQAQWRTVAVLPRIDRDLNPDPSRFKGDNLPVEQVSWYDVVEFCARLSKASGKNYRLPSEAEWEYACRAGTVTPFHFGETLTTELANYNGNYTYREEAKGESRKETAPVGTFSANAFGLFDMHGNVYEWCADLWHDNYAPIDGSPWLENIENNNQYWLVRGASWYSNPEYCRSANRSRVSQDDDSDEIGFRVVCVRPPRAE